jgi:hypothetical protein
MAAAIIELAPDVVVDERLRLSLPAEELDEVRAAEVMGDPGRDVDVRRLLETKSIGDPQLAAERLFFRELPGGLYQRDSGRRCAGRWPGAARERPSAGPAGDGQRHRSRR